MTLTYSLRIEFCMGEGQTNLFQKMDDTMGLKGQKKILKI